MSFLLGRANPRQSAGAGGSAGGSRNEVLYDADMDERGGRGRSDEDEDDELEAAFGDAEDDRHFSHNLSQRTLDLDASTTQEEAQLLRPGSNDGHDDGDEGPYGTRHDRGSSSSSTSLPRTVLSRSASTATVNSGGYDFERDPYDRNRTIGGGGGSIGLGSSPASGLGLGNSGSDSMGQRGSRASRTRSNTHRNRRGGRASNGGGGILVAVHNALPARWRRYGLLGTDGSGGSSSRNGRRSDGNTDHGDLGEDDDEDEIDDDWDAPPPSIPGLYGGGTNNDGVFSNLMAKPGGRTRDGDTRDVVGGDDEAPEKEIPPAYEMAVLDSAPPYFDTTVHAPATGSGYFSAFGLPGQGGIEEILIEGLPLGNMFSFFWSLLVSMSFQFVGFLLTTLLSTSHAAKNGSRAGLGITLIQYGLFLQSQEDNAAGNTYVIGGPGEAAGDGPAETGQDAWAAFWGEPTPTTTVAEALLATATSVSRTQTTSGTPSLMGLDGNSSMSSPILLDGSAAVSGVAGSWLSMVLMIGGWFLLVSSVTAYIKAFRYAKALRDGGSNNPSSLAEIGGPLAWISRLTGQEVRREERVWGLPARRAPVTPSSSFFPGVADFGRSTATPAVPPDSSRPPPASASTAGIPSGGSL